LQTLGQARPLILHGHGLALGNPTPLDSSALNRFAGMAAALAPMWVTAALGFSRVPGTDLGFPTPIPLNERSLLVAASHARRLMEACGTPLLVRNIAGYLEFRSSLPEPDFLNRLCARAGCGLCLDLASLYVNARDRGFDPQRWIAAIDARHVTQITVGGCRDTGDGWQLSFDRSPCSEVLALAEYVCARADVQAAVIERHAAFAPAAELAADLDRVRRLRHGGVRSESTARVDEPLKSARR
jgi:uncharacterized protein (UPF0276 family)